MLIFIHPRAIINCCSRCLATTTGLHLLKLNVSELNLRERGRATHTSFSNPLSMVLEAVESPPRLLFDPSIVSL